MHGWENAENIDEVEEGEWLLSPVGVASIMSQSSKAVLATDSLKQISSYYKINNTNEAAKKLKCKTQKQLSVVVINNAQLIFDKNRHVFLITT